MVGVVFVRVVGGRESGEAGETKGGGSRRFVARRDAAGGGELYILFLNSISSSFLFSSMARSKLWKRNVT